MSVMAFDPARAEAGNDKPAARPTTTANANRRTRDKPVAEEHIDRVAQNNLRNAVPPGIGCVLRNDMVAPIN